MDIRECFLATCRFEPVDYMPIFSFQGFVGGVGEETCERWSDKEAFPPARSSESLHAYFGIERPELIPVEVGLWPPFRAEVLEITPEGLELVRLPSGVISTQVPNNAKVYSMPQFHEWPVKSRADWEALRERLQPGEYRYPRNWPRLVEAYRQRHNVLRVGAGAGYLGGYYGRLRSLMGFERLSTTYYDDPQLIKDMNAYHVDYLIQVLDRCFSDVEVDMVVIGEDMAGRNGSLISPAMFREFLLPYYQRFTGFCRDHGVASIWVDSDGDIRQLVPLWLEAGINGVGPIDNVVGQVDVVELGEAYPQLLMAGGLDKRVIEEGRTFAEIDAELERKVPPLLRRGGYFPGPDHGWTPRASLDNYRHFHDKLRELCGGEA